ncbi:MAG: response regulator transcription factor [Nitrospirae bacterium]|nr:MAG: response regulator transcription factor [Nitrospirota bacterium]
MLNAIPTNLSLPAMHRNEQRAHYPNQEPDSPSMPPQRALLQAVIVTLGSTIGSLLMPSMMPHLLRGIGRELGTSFYKPDGPVKEVGQEPEHEAAMGSLHEQLLDCLQLLKAQWGCRYQIVGRSLDRLDLAILDCPLEPRGDAPLHLCWLYAGMLGEVAGNRLGYAKTSLGPCAGSPALCGTSEAAAEGACNITLYLQKTAESVAAEGTSYPQAQQTPDHLPSRARTGLPLDRLSDREWQVLRLIGEGFSDKEIADALKMSVRTAENHASKVYTKLGVRGRARLIRYALHHRVVNI